MSAVMVTLVLWASAGLSDSSTLLFLGIWGIPEDCPHWLDVVILGSRTLAVNGTGACRWGSRGLHHTLLVKEHIANDSITLESTALALDIDCSLTLADKT